MSDVQHRKIKNREKELNDLFEEIEAAYKQKRYAQSEVEKVRLEREIENKEAEAKELEHKIERLRNGESVADSQVDSKPLSIEDSVSSKASIEIDPVSEISPPIDNSQVTENTSDRLNSDFAINDAQVVPKKIASFFRDTLRLSKLGRFKKRTTAASFATAVGIVFVRSVGLLEGTELKIYDQFLKYRPSESIDEHILVIGITQNDLDLKQEYERLLGRTCTNSVGSLPDCVYDELLMRLEPYEPKAIGLDLYRADLVGNGFAAAPDSPVLAQYLKGEGVAPLFSVCKASIPEIDLPGTDPPVESSPEHVGFSDFVGGQESDDELITRRHLLWMNITPEADERGNPCESQNSFNLAIASHYLDLTPQFEDQDRRSLKLTEEISIPKINSNSGGYQAVDASGYQTLLNYRAHKDRTSSQPPSPLNAISQMSLADALKNTNGRLERFVSDNIVLIGRVDDNSEDLWRIPYNQSLVPGVIIQAQMISQIINAVEEGRPFLTTWSEPQEYLWIWLWFGIGFLLYLTFSYKRSILFISLSFSMAGLIILSLFFLYQKSTWIPIVPPAFMLLSPTLVSYVVYTRFDKND